MKTTPSYRFSVTDRLGTELQHRGFDPNSTAGYEHVSLTRVEDLTGANRALYLYSSGVAVCEEPFRNYPDQGRQPHAAFPFVSEADLLAQLDKIGWGPLSEPLVEEAPMQSLRAGMRMLLTNRRFPAGFPCQVNERINGTQCWTVFVDIAGPLLAYALETELHPLDQPS